MKCDKNSKMINGKCEKKSKIPFLTTKDTSAVKKNLISAVALLGTWTFFWGIVRLFDLNNQNPYFLIVVGFIVTILSARFLIRK